MYKFPFQSGVNILPFFCDKYRGKIFSIWGRFLGNGKNFIEKMKNNKNIQGIVDALNMWDLLHNAIGISVLKI